MRPKISELLNKITEFTNSSSLTPLEFDLLKQTIRNLYEEVERLKSGLVKETEAGKELKQEQPKITKVNNEPVLHVVSSNENLIATKDSINEKIPSSGSLNEKLKTSNKTEIHKHLSTKPLKELIDMNKRFVLVNELFKGNSDNFSQAVQHIDSVSNYEDAKEYVRAELFNKHQWEETSQSVRMFLKLVKQKFGEE
ncbi:MAG: hypothetical protein NTY88_07045 [Bacteroidetes bacterium]|nr:hypothetical protein [Bacteroidota bacterium]